MLNIPIGPRLSFISPAAGGSSGPDDPTKSEQFGAWRGVSDALESGGRCAFPATHNRKNVIKTMASGPWLTMPTPAEHSEPCLDSNSVKAYPTEFIVNQ